MFFTIFYSFPRHMCVTAFTVLLPFLSGLSLTGSVFCYVSTFLYRFFLWIRPPKTNLGWARTPSGPGWHRFVYILFTSSPCFDRFLPPGLAGTVFYRFRQPFFTVFGLRKDSKRNVKKHVLTVSLTKHIDGMPMDATSFHNT